MTTNNTDRLIETLQRWPGLDDDQLANQAGIQPRQQVNQICRRLAEAGRLHRALGKEGKIVNTLTDTSARPTSEARDRHIEINNFQRVGSIRNTHVGQEFELAAQAFFATTGIPLTPSFGVPVGHIKTRLHKFDLGSEEPPILVECKSYTWTSGGNSPGAKIRSMNAVMLLFSVAPVRYRKILFVLIPTVLFLDRWYARGLAGGARQNKDLYQPPDTIHESILRAAGIRHLRKELSLAKHYIATQGHLIGPGIEI